MSYADRFLEVDTLVAHISSNVSQQVDGLILASYSGFISVSAVTVFELSVKDILTEFAKKKNGSFGSFVSSSLEQINGRIKLNDLKEKHIKPFGQKYLDKFVKNLDCKEQEFISGGNGSIKSSYNNIIQCRHSFVHRGSPTLSINEIIRHYDLGKEVLHVLHHVMVR